MLALAREGLKARNRLDGSGENETGFLTPLQESADSGETPADRKLRLFEDDWNESVDPVFEDFAY